MRKFSVFLLAAVAGIMMALCPACADNPESDANTGIIRSDDAVMIDGSVTESPASLAQKHRRRSLASRGGLIVNTATRYLGTPYRWAGTSPSGFDCSGFVMTMYSMNGLSIRRMADEQYYGGAKLKKEELLPGDLVFFTTYGPGVTHVGIYMGDDRFIHSSSTRGVTISSLNDSYYRNRFIGGCRY